MKNVLIREKKKKEITSVIQWREILMADIEYDNKYSLLKWLSNVSFFILFFKVHRHTMLFLWIDEA